MKNKQLITGAVVATAVAGIAAYFFMRKRRNASLQNVENDAHSGTGWNNPAKKLHTHLTDVFHNAKMHVKDGHPAMH